MRALIVAAMAIAALGSPAFAAAGDQHVTQPQAAFVCPVTGNKIVPASKAAGHSSYKGRTYYFCCAGCKPKFDKIPQHYVTNAAHGHYEKM